MRCRDGGGEGWGRVVLARGSGTEGLCGCGCLCVCMRGCGGCAGNELGPEGMAALAPELRSVPGLQELDLKSESGRLARRAGSDEGPG